MYETKVTIPPRTDYSAEVEVLKRLLSPGALPMGDSFGWSQPELDEIAYLGEAEVSCHESWVKVKGITSDELLWDAIREAARTDENYDEEDDEVKDLDFSELAVEVSYPFTKMSPFERARYQLRVLLVNSQGVLDGDAHSWALFVSKDQAADYWRRSDAKLGDWNADCCPDESALLDLLIEKKIDLSRWSSAYDVWGEEDLEEMPPFKWIQEHGILKSLFGLSDEEIRYGDNELERAIAYALEALIEDQPPEWEHLLYLNDIQSFAGLTFEASRDRIADRMEELPIIASFTERIRATTTYEEVNAVMKDFYEVAPSLKVWVVA